MVSFNAGDVRRCLTTKLGTATQQGHDHDRYVVFDDHGRVVAVTKLSRSWRGTTAIGSSMMSTLQRQLRLQGRAREFEALIRCPLSRAEYLDLVSPGDPEP